MSPEDVSRPSYRNNFIRLYQTADNVQNDSLRSPVITTNQLHTSYSLWSTNFVNKMRGHCAYFCRCRVVSLYWGCVLLNLTIYYSKHKLAFRNPTYYMAGRDSSVGVATPYGLDGPGIKSRWKRPFTPTLGSTQPSAKWVSGLFPGSKTPGTWRLSPIPF
jgi:hypothetical protein